jgi:hypothetical protein
MACRTNQNEKKRSKSEEKHYFVGWYIYVYALAALSRTKYGKPPLIYTCRIYQQTHVYTGIRRRLLPGGNTSLSIIPLLPLTHALAIAAAAFVLIFISRHAESINSFPFPRYQQFQYGTNFASIYYFPHVYYFSRSSHTSPVSDGVEDPGFFIIIHPTRCLYPLNNFRVVA